MFKLPVHIQQIIYEYDSTYRELFNVVLLELHLSYECHDPVLYLHAKKHRLWRAISLHRYRGQMRQLLASV